MPDLFDALKGTPDPLGRPPLPADEVRRRGDRMRRRRTAGSAVGAALAVALVVGGGIALSGELSTGTGPAPLPPANQTSTGVSDPSPTPEGGWRITIPTGFPLADDLPRTVGSDGEIAGPGRDVRLFDTPFEACGRKTMLGAPEDDLKVRLTLPEWYDGRQLLAYADDVEARQVLTDLVGVYAQCPEQTYAGPPDTVATNKVLPADLGEEGYVVQRTFTTEGLPTTGLELIHVVRVGNALLVTLQSTEGGASEEGTAGDLADRDTALAPVAEAMCVFSADGC